MLHLNKLLAKINEDSKIFKSNEIIFKLGLTTTHIKNLKKYALENQLITQSRQEYFLTQKGKEFLLSNPIQKWSNKEYYLRPEINVEYLKEEKTPATLTKALRLLAKNLLHDLPLKDYSLEHALIKDIELCENLLLKIEEDILDNKKICLENIFAKYLNKGITKSLTALLLIKILVKNSDKIAIYEKSQFQLKFDHLMFDRMIACPENFEIQKTEMLDEYLLKDISKIILNQKSQNILEITKGLYKIIKSLDKYTMNTQNLKSKTLRLRNIIINAKDPISLFERDIPKALGNNSLKDCDRKFLNLFKNSLNELKDCTQKLTKDLKLFILDSFKASSKDELIERFSAITDFIGDKDLKILFNNITEKNIDDDLWTNRIATFINKYRVPKDWSDEDYADFKLKTKELTVKFFAIESIVGISDNFASKNYKTVLDKFLKLTKQEQTLIIREYLKT